MRTWRAEGHSISLPAPWRVSAGPIFDRQSGPRPVRKARQQSARAKRLAPGSHNNGLRFAKSTYGLGGCERCPLVTADRRLLAAGKKFKGVKIRAL